MQIAGVQVFDYCYRGRFFRIIKVLKQKRGNYKVTITKNKLITVLALLWYLL